MDVCKSSKSPMTWAKSLTVEPWSMLKYIFHGLEILFLVIFHLSLFWYISVLIQTETCYPFFFSMVLMDLFHSQAIFFSSLCCIWKKKLILDTHFWENWVVVKGQKNTFRKSRGEIKVLFSPRIFFLALQSLYCFSSETFQGTLCCHCLPKLPCEGTSKSPVCILTERI